MDELKNIDYRGIGEGLSIACRRDLSPSESTISLDDDWWSSHRHLRREARSSASTTIDAELGTKSNEGPSVTIHGAQPVSVAHERYLQLISTPLERYCYHVQAHEQFAVGQITDRQSLIRLNELNNSLDATAELVMGVTSQISTSSSISSSTSDGDPDEPEALPMMDSPEFRAAPQEEQAKYLRRIAKLRRRLKVEGGPRAMKSVRVRKRSRTSNKSNETGHGGVGFSETS
ncbi:hypothetical protein ANO14919_009720 [Xylariales sp. No.14919]|nr:hypothetical protein ANO14919_009720 [Xylariales sp. No.14919]